MKTLTEEEFETQFTPVPYTPEGDIVRPNDDGLDKTSDKLWTIVTGDSGAQWALSGWHHVNREGYILTEESWTEPTEGLWLEAPEDEDDDIDDLEEEG